MPSPLCLQENRLVPAPAARSCSWVWLCAHVAWVRLYVGHASRPPEWESPLHLRGGNDIENSTESAITGIPKTIFFTGPWSPDEVVRRNRHFVPPGTEFRYYTTEQLDQSAKATSDKLAAAGVPGVYAAFRQLRPIAFRADLWRYMILWENGGVYLDAKLVLSDKIFDWLDCSCDKIVACDDTDFSRASGKRKYWNAVIAAHPKETALLSTIRYVVANVESRSYGPPTAAKPSLWVTGPGALTQGIEESGRHPTLDCGFEKGRDRGAESGFVIDSKVVWYPAGKTLLVSDADVHAEMKTCSDCNDFGDLVRAHALYCDEPALPGVADPCVQPASSFVQSIDVDLGAESERTCGGRGYWRKVV